MQILLTLKRASTHTMELQRDVVSIKTERTLKQEEHERKMQREK